MLASIAGARGSVEERDRQIERSGIYGEYPAIVRAYEELFGDADSGVEALKRATFLIWHGAMQPPWETGIAPLPDGTMRSVVTALGDAIRRSVQDAELGWMLACYHAQSPDLLELYGATGDLMRFVQSESPEAWRSAQITPVEMTLRGQMGRYWREKANGAR